METGLHGVVGTGGEQRRRALLGHAGNDAGDRAGDLLVHSIPDVAQFSSLKALELSDDELIAVELDGTLDGAGDSVGGATGQRLLELVRRLAQLGLQVLHTSGNLVNAALERSGSGVNECQAVGHVVEGALRGNGLDTADVRARGGLGDNLEQADLGSVGSMRTTAELAGERLVLGAHGNDADDVAILLAKQGDGAGGLGLVDAHDAGHDRLRCEDLLVDQVLNSLELLGGQGLKVREVKAQVLGRHQRASLGDMLAQDLLKGGVEQVRGGVVAAQESTALGVERGGHGSTNGQRALGDVRDVGIQAVVVLGIGNGQRNALGGKLAGIALLAAHLGIERGAVEHDLDILARGSGLDGLAVAHDGDNLGALDHIVVIAVEIGRSDLVRKLDPHVVEAAPGIALCVGAGAGLLVLHASGKAIHIDVVASSAGDLDSQVDGETKGVVQLKGDIARKHGALGKSCQGLVQVDAAVVERRGEALLLRGDDTLDERDVLEQLGVGLAHLSVDLVDELGQEGALDAQQATVEHGTAEQTAKDVLTTLVTGEDAVRDHEVDGAGVVGDDTQRAAGTGIVIGVIGLAADLLTELDEVLHQIAVVVSSLVLHNSGHALQAHACIEVAMRQLRHGAVLLAVVLGKDEVPELQEAVAVTAGLAGRATATDLLAHVKVDLGARAAGAGGTSCPEVIVLAQAGDVVLGNAQRTPHVVGLVVLGKDGEVQAIERQLELLGDELKGPGASLLLGDAAKGEVAEHLEEGQMTAVLADAVDVVGADALLAGDRADLLHGLLALVVLLKLVHAGVGKQQRGVVGDEGRRRIELKTALLKEVEELGADLGRSH